MSNGASSHFEAKKAREGFRQGIVACLLCVSTRPAG